MKNLSTLFAVAATLFFSATQGQETRVLYSGNADIALSFSGESAGQWSPFGLAKQVEASSLAISGYSAGETQDIFFSITLVNEDNEWGDSLSLTFPDGFTINGVSNDDVFGPVAAPGLPAAAFNGIAGQVVSWGDNNNDLGGIQTGAEFVFSVNVTVAAGLSGPQAVDLHVSGDTFDDQGPAGDFDAVITITEGQTIAGIVINSPDHTTLLSALGAAGLVNVFATNGPFTLFAPTDDAFDALEASSPGIIASLLADPTELLTQVLLYHVVSGEAFEMDLMDGDVLSTLQIGGQTLAVSTVGGIFINDAQVTTADLNASNGIVHVIDAVLIPEEETTVWDVVQESDVHNTLEAAVLAAGLEGALNSFNEQFTLFAPTDDAFAALGAAIDDLLLDPEGALANVLRYHLVAGVTLSDALTDGQEVVTAQGDILNVTIDGEMIMVNNATITVEDIETVNGVVHVVDAVLLPPTCTAFLNGPFANLNTAWGGAPSPENSACPYNLFTGFEVLASEAYTIANFVEGRTYTFGVTGGAAGVWELSIVVINSTSGAVVASAEGSSVTWISPESGSYTFIIQEAGFCGGQSENIGIGNGFPFITCGEGTVVDIIANSEVHTTLETAVLAAGLEGALNGEGPFTVFAPTDEAFAQLDPDLLAALLANPEGALTQILQHHVVADLAYASDLSDGQELETLLGDDVMVGIAGNTVTITSSSGNAAGVTIANLVASNGVVHVIDAVLLPAVVNTENIRSVASLGVYPNPTSDQFTIDLDLIEAGPITIDLINVLGQAVKNQSLGMRSAGLNRSYVDVSDLPAGFYIMNIAIGNDQVSTKVQITK